MSDVLGEMLQAAGIDGLARPGWLVAALLAALLAMLLAWRARPPAVGRPSPAKQILVLKDVVE